MVSKPKKLSKIIGIDISENDIIASEVTFTKNNININSGFRLPIPVFQDINKTIALLKQNLKALNIKTKECVIGFSMQYFKLLPVPIPASIPQDEISSIIIQEGNIDPTAETVTWIKLNNTQRQDPDGVERYDVLGISIEKSFLDIAKHISKNCNLKLTSVSPSFLGIGSLLGPLSSNNLIGTLWISQIRSEFVVWSGQEPIYEHLFLTHQLNDQVFQSVNYIQTQLAGTQVAAILSCGTYANETNLSQVPFNIQPFPLPQNFVDTGNVLQGISVSEIIPSLGIALASSYNFAYTTPDLLSVAQVRTTTQGKGLKDIFKDISKAQIDKSKSLKLPFTIGKSLDPQTSKFVTASVMVLLVSILSGLYIQNFLSQGIQANQTVADSKLTLVQTHLAKLLNIEKKNKVLNLKVDYFSELIDKRKPWSKILREIGDITPEGLWIDRLDIRRNSIDIFGRAINVDSVANFSINLNYTAKLLGGAQIIALRKFQEDDLDLIEYQVNVKVVEKDKVALDKNTITEVKSKPKI